MDTYLEKFGALPLGGRAISLLAEYCTMPDANQDIKFAKSGKKEGVACSWRNTEDVVNGIRKISIKKDFKEEVSLPPRNFRKLDTVSIVRNQMCGVLDDLYAFQTAYYDENKIVKDGGYR